jgi:SurA N-terminal domain/PPIC-type PPIASE domain
MQKPLISTISILGLAFFITGCKGGGGGGEVMATVNGETISKDEYISHLERKVQVLVQSQNGPAQVPVAQPLNFQALNDLVNQKLLLQMAKKENVLPTEADITAEMQFQVSKRSDFVAALTGQGLTITDIKDELMISLARHKLLSKGVTISDAQIDAYIRENPKQFENPKLVDLTWIVLKNAADKAKVDSDLKTGQTFAIVAKNFTTAPSGPQYPSREYDKFPARLKGVVDKLAENGTSDWLQDGTSFVKIHVEKKTPASKLDIKPWMKTEISRLLAEQKGSAAMDIDKRLLNSRKAAAIVITKPALKDRFDKLSKTLKEADIKNSTAGSKTK